MRSVVPEPAVLVGQQDEPAALVEPGVAAGVVEQHQRQKPERLRLVGHEQDEHLREPDRLLAEIGARRRPVALVEDQVQDREHRAEALRQQVIGRDAERNPRGADLPLGAHEALGHRRLRDEEGARDLLGAEPTQRAESQRHLRLGRERRMAAREDQAQPLVGNGVCLLRLRGLEGREQLGLARERPLPPDPVDRPVSCRRQQPCPGVRRGAVAGPALQGRSEGLLHRVLGELHVAERAGEDRERAPPLLAEDGFDYEPSSSKTITGLTSTEPWRAPGIFAAQPIASSSESASIR